MRIWSVVGRLAVGVGVGQGASFDRGFQEHGLVCRREQHEVVHFGWDEDACTGFERIVLVAAGFSRSLYEGFSADAVVDCEASGLVTEYVKGILQIELCNLEFITLRQLTSLSTVFRRH